MSSDDAPGPSAPPGRDGSTCRPAGRRRSHAGTFRSVVKELRLCADRWRRGGVLDAGARARLGVAGPILELVAVTPAKITVQLTLAEWYRSLGDGALVCVKAGDA